MLPFHVVLEVLQSEARIFKQRSEKHKRWSLNRVSDLLAREGFDTLSDAERKDLESRAKARIAAAPEIADTTMLSELVPKPPPKPTAKADKDLALKVGTSVLDALKRGPPESEAVAKYIGVRRFITKSLSSGGVNKKRFDAAAPGVRIKQMVQNPKLAGRPYRSYGVADSEYHALLKDFSQSSSHWSLKLSKPSSSLITSKTAITQHSSASLVSVS